MLELPARPRIAIVGAGAVGGYYGARMAQRGADVHFLMRSDYQAVRQHGLTIKSRDGDFVLSPVQVYDDPRKMPPADLVIVALKTTANDQFERLIAPLLKPTTLILTLQNGLGNEQRLAELFGAQRILGGLAFVCINRTAPGVIHHTDYGFIKLGAVQRGASPAAQQVAQLFGTAGVRCDVLEDLQYGRWEKLVWNVPFNGLSAALDLTTDRLIATAQGSNLVRQIMLEVITTARAQGVALVDDLADVNLQRTRSMGPYFTSMHLDRRHGRSMEVEAIVGQPLRAARASNVPTPAMAWLYDLLTAVNAAVVAASAS